MHISGEVLVDVRAGAAELLSEGVRAEDWDSYAWDGSIYGDSMILTECIFSQPAPGSVSSAYFCKLVHFSACGVQIFANTRGVFANF